MNQTFIKPANIVADYTNKELTILPQNDKRDLIHFFDKEEILILMANITNGKHAMLFQFLWRTGIRVSECIKVRKRDVDLTNNTIQIRWLKSRKYNYRIIPMHSSLKTILMMYIGTLKEDEMLFPISRQRVDQLSKKYGFCHAHKLRHSFAVNFLRQTDSAMGIVELKELLGHSNIRTTMEYLKVVPQNQAKALAKIMFD